MPRHPLCWALPLVLFIALELELGGQSIPVTLELHLYNSTWLFVFLYSHYCSDEKGYCILLLIVSFLKLVLRRSRLGRLMKLMTA